MCFPVCMIQNGMIQNGKIRLRASVARLLYCFRLNPWEDFKGEGSEGTRVREMRMSDNGEG